MDGRYWVWLGMRLLVGVAIVGWAASYLMPGSGEKEFQRTLDALKQVHSVRIASTATALNQSSETLWEVSCAQPAYHYTWHAIDTTNGPPREIYRDEMHVGTLQYDHQSDDSWAPSKHWNTGSTATNLCTRISEGSGDNGPMPAIATMIRRGILQKGDKKMVGGVRCREWNVTLKGPTGLEHDTVCLGVDDHLPYESTVDWLHSRTLYSDYNSPVQLVLPEAAVQATSASTESN